MPGDNPGRAGSRDGRSFLAEPRVRPDPQDPVGLATSVSGWPARHQTHAAAGVTWGPRQELGHQIKFIQCIRCHSCRLSTPRPTPKKMSLTTLPNSAIPKTTANYSNKYRQINAYLKEKYQYRNHKYGYNYYQASRDEIFRPQLVDFVCHGYSLPLIFSTLMVDPTNFVPPGQAGAPTRWFPRRRTG